MKKKKIGYYILFILFLGIFINSFIAYISYKEVLNGMIDKAIETETAGSKPYMKIIKRNNSVK